MSFVRDNRAILGVAALGVGMSAAALVTYPKLREGVAEVVTETVTEAVSALPPLPVIWPKDRLQTPPGQPAKRHPDAKVARDGIMELTYTNPGPGFYPDSLVDLYLSYGSRAFRVILDRDGSFPGLLVGASVMPFEGGGHWMPVTPTDGKPQFDDSSWSRARRNFSEIVADRALMIRCHYASPHGPEHPYQFHYWFKTRPVKAEPAYLNSIYSGGNPMAKIGGPRDDCPRTYDAAKALLGPPVTVCKTYC